MIMRSRMHDDRNAPLAALALILALAGCAAADERTRPATASIEGVIQHPAHAVPAMRICALSTSDTREPHRCTTTRAGADTYRIDGLSPGDYQVFADARNGLYRLGGHMQAVQCIRAPCPEQPKTIALTAGALLDGIYLTFFDEARADLPALRPEDLAAALVEGTPHRTSFVPDAAGTGTTLYAADGDAAFAPRFGPTSRKAHLESGAVEVDGAASVRQDVDTPEDLGAALALGVGARTARVVQRAGLPW